LRDETGKKLSKSLGNSPDPIELFNEYGTDAVRFGVMLMAPQGLDVLFSKDRLEIGRNFMNKLWNVCMFIQLNMDSIYKYDIKINDEEYGLPDRWILSRLSRAVTDYNRQLDRFHFNEAAKVLYDFTWNDFCDWYVEIAKTRFYENDERQSDVTRVIALKCVRTILTLLHPFSPFITEELWTYFKSEKSPDLIISPWVKDEGGIDNSADQNMDILKEFITSIRSIRSRMNVPPSKYSDLFIRCTEEKKNFLNQNINLIKTLARVKEISMGDDIQRPKQSAMAICFGLELYIPLGGLVDLDEEKKRMLKRITEIDRLLMNINGKLSNDNFMQRAPQIVIDKEKSNLNKLNEELEKITINLGMLE
jgi:valyl-tRNA synthetase